MGRAILPGSRVKIGAAGRPRPGRIWAYCGPDGQVVVHRCLARCRGGFLFRGDASPAVDPLVPAEALIGAVIAVDYGGKVSSVGLLDWLGHGLPRCLRVQAARLLAGVKARVRRPVDRQP